MARGRHTRRRNSRRHRHAVSVSKRGGSPVLAYPSSNVPMVRNPHLAYTGRGGSTVDLARTMPNPGLAAGGFNFMNPLTGQGGGCCGTGACQAGGKKVLTNGKKALTGGAPYPNGLAGQPWTPNPATWPGVDGVDGNRNFFPLNTYKTDVQLAIKDLGANRPFLAGGKRRRSKSTHRRARRRSLRGGGSSNLIFQDVTDFARGVQSSAVGMYNGLTGHEQPVSVLPWRGQFHAPQ